MRKRPADQQGAITKFGTSITPVPALSDRRCPVCRLQTCCSYRQELAERSWRVGRRLGRAAGIAALREYLDWAYGCPEIVDAIVAISREIDAEERAGSWPPPEHDQADDVIVPFPFPRRRRL